MPTDPNELLEVLSTIEAWNSRTGYWLTEAGNFLTKFRLVYLAEKGERSEAERKIQLEAAVADYEMVKEKMEILCNAIKQRLILGESILAYHRQFNIKPIMEKAF